MSNNKIPKQYLANASGFPDFGPGEAIALRRMLDVIREQYECAGFAPIDTPLVERLNILSAKSEDEIDNQIYGLRLVNPAPDAMTDTKDLALRFDHTVPLARFLAKNYGNITFPFRRYAIGPVFRGERPKPKEGRYRQFTQADIDVIGDGSLSLLYDAEMVSIVTNIFQELAIGSFTTRVSNRKILHGLLQSIGVRSGDISAAFTAIDKLDKISVNEVVRMLSRLGVDTGQARDLVDLLTQDLSDDAIIADLRQRSSNAIFEEGLSELERAISGIRRFGVPEDAFCIDLSIARGLDYYTGTVYETRFDEHQDVGSIASGGRYSELARAFTNRSLPGVGMSIGVTRLLLRLIASGLMDANTATMVPVLVTSALGIEEYSSVYLEQTRELRDAGVGAEVYLENQPLGKQIRFADRKGFTIAVITQEENLVNNTVTVRDLKNGTQNEIARADLADAVIRMLS